MLTLADVDAALQRSLVVISIASAILLLVVKLYRMVRRVDRAITRVEDQVKPNGSARAAGTQDLTTRDLMDQAQREMVGFRLDLNKVRRRNDKRHEETRADMREMREALQAQTETAGRTSADVFARLAALENRKHDNRPPALEMEEDG